MVGRERYAQATSTFYIFFDLGIGAAPYLAGFVVPHTGYEGLYGLNGLLVLACILGYLALRAKGLVTVRPSSGRPLDLKGAGRS